MHNTNWIVYATSTVVLRFYVHNEVKRRRRRRKSNSFKFVCRVCCYFKTVFRHIVKGKWLFIDFNFRISRTQIAFCEKKKMKRNKHQNELQLGACINQRKMMLSFLLRKSFSLTTKTFSKKKIIKCFNFTEFYFIFSRIFKSWASFMWNRTLT